jgi:hypothetical protein
MHHTSVLPYCTAALCYGTSSLRHCCNHTSYHNCVATAATFLLSEPIISTSTRIISYDCAFHMQLKSTDLYLTTLGTRSRRTRSTSIAIAAVLTVACRRASPLQWATAAVAATAAPAPAVIVVIQNGVCVMLVCLDHASGSSCDDSSSNNSSSAEQSLHYACLS